MNDFPIFVINLDGSDARLADATRALGNQQASFARVAAYDGRGKDLAGVPEYNSAGTRAYMGRDLSGGEVGCFISHVEAAKAFVETGAPFGLVLEDDMAPLPDALHNTAALILEQAAQNTPDWHLAHLAAATLKTATLISCVGNYTLHRAHYFPMRTTALLWSREGAKSFIADAYPITCPVDIHLRRWLRVADMGVAVSPPFFTTTEAQSEIAPTQTRGKSSRSALYTAKRLARVATDKIEARKLQRRAQKGRP